MAKYSVVIAGKGAGLRLRYMVGALPATGASDLFCIWAEKAENGLVAPRALVTVGFIDHATAASALHDLVAWHHRRGSTVDTHFEKQPFRLGTDKQMEREMRAHLLYVWLEEGATVGDAFAQIERCLLGEALPDLHARTAHRMFNVPTKDVTPSMRQAAKAATFMHRYGGAVRRLVRDE